MGKKRSGFRWNDRRRRFVERYCAHFNRPLAAIEAGFSERRARRTAYDLLQMPEIREAVDARMRELSMSAAEATLRMTNWGRGTLAPFLTEDGRVDLSTDEARMNVGLVKKLKVTERRFEDRTIQRKTEIEIHDAKDAVDKMMKVHGLYQDEGAPIDVRVLLVRDVDDVKPGGPE